MSESKKGVMLKPGFMRVLGEMPAPGLGFYSRHLTEDDVQVISANTRKLIFNNGQVKHELGNDRFKPFHCVMCLINNHQKKHKWFNSDLSNLTHEQEKILAKDISLMKAEFENSLEEESDEY